MLRPRLAYKPFFFSEIWINVAHKVTVPLTILWPSPRFWLFKIFKIILSNPSIIDLKSLRWALQKSFSLVQVFTFLVVIFFALRKNQHLWQKILIKKKEQYWQSAIRFFSEVCKNLNHITCFNCDQKKHHVTNYLEPQRDVLED